MKMSLMMGYQDKEGIDDIHYIPSDGTRLHDTRCTQPLLVVSRIDGKKYGNRCWTLMGEIALRLEH
jgi:hypothetical protein